MFNRWQQVRRIVILLIFLGNNHFPRVNTGNVDIYPIFFIQVVGVLVLNTKGIAHFV